MPFLLALGCINPCLLLGKHTADVSLLSTIWRIWCAEAKQIVIWLPKEHVKKVNIPFPVSWVMCYFLCICILYLFDTSNSNAIGHYSSFEEINLPCLQLRKETTANSRSCWLRFVFCLMQFYLTGLIQLQLRTLSCQNCLQLCMGATLSQCEGLGEQLMLSNALLIEQLWLTFFYCWEKIEALGNYIMTSVKVRNTCLQEFSELSALISSIKCQKGLRQQFITCDDIFTEGASQKAHHVFIIFSGA